MFKVKYNNDKKVKQYKTRLCARGFTRLKDKDYFDTFVPTARYDSIRLLLCIATSIKYKIAQFDVKTAFLHSELEEDIYMSIPKSVLLQKDEVCKLLKYMDLNSLLDFGIIHLIIFFNYIVLLTTKQIFGFIC